MSEKVPGALPMPGHSLRYDPVDLDLLESIKLVNYIRMTVKNVQRVPTVSSKADFQDDSYLIPTLENDALLYSLEDVISTGTISEGAESDGE